MYVHDNSSPGIKGQIACVGSEEHYWLGLNRWKMGMAMHTMYVMFTRDASPDHGVRDERIRRNDVFVAMAFFLTSTVMCSL